MGKKSGVTGTGREKQNNPCATHTKWEREERKMNMV